MKHVLAVAAVISLFAFATVPAEATIACHAVANSTTTTPIPPECLREETKAKHPGWYRDGGYCDGAGTQAAAGTTRQACPDPI